ncbi:MAG: hypothetical protein WBA46_17180 [Thermomicrobiales bacterium]
MSDTANGVIVRLASGAEYGLKDAETAKAIYPGGVIVSYVDGRPYEHDGDETPATREDLTAALGRANRAELDEHAKQLDLNPDDYRTKAEITEAILANTAFADELAPETEDTDPDGETDEPDA